MGNAFLYGNGGGGAVNVFAVIAVTYPAGSVCTCSNGTKTLNAKDTSGEYLFLVPSAGTWVVSCTDGVRSSSASAIITTVWQAANVSLAYQTYLFSHETGAIAGYYANAQSSSSSITVNSNSINIAYTYPSGNGVIFRNDTPAIDVTPYSTLHIVYNTNSNYNVMWFGVSSTKFTNVFNQSAFDVASAKFGSASGQVTQTLDVSQATGSCYVGLAGVGLSTNIYDFWLD